RPTRLCKRLTPWVPGHRGRRRTARRPKGLVNAGVLAWHGRGSGRAMASHSSHAVRYSIVIPIFNEEAVLPILLRRVETLMDALDGPVETFSVDDGSPDCGSMVLEAKPRDAHRCRYIGLPGNFGHQIAITAGMDAAKGDAVIVMDADLQDPPEVV